MQAIDNVFSVYRTTGSTSRKRVHSKNAKKIFHIGLQPKSAKVSGALGLSMVAFWEGILTENDIRVIYKTGKHSMSFLWTL